MISLSVNPSRPLSVGTAGVLPAVVAMLFGAFLVWGVGFAAPAAIHDAAHDARHAFTFPCH